MSETIEIAKRTFELIQQKFPNLTMRIHNDGPVELSLEIKKQNGLNFDIDLNLQNNDELHFSVGHFWCEWFPCTKQAEVDEYIDLVSGFISGQYRILEHCRGKRIVKSELQSPENDSWKTRATCMTPSFPFPIKKTFNVVQNI